ncbi:hypothetical protein EJB05_03152, partial [Eragrostis curvula]
MDHARAEQKRTGKERNITDSGLFTYRQNRQTPSLDCTCPYESRVAAVTRGTAHWIFIGTGPNGNSIQILDVSINTRHVAATEIPFDAMPKR